MGSALKINFQRCSCNLHALGQGKIFFFETEKVALQKVGKRSKTPNSIEIFQLLPLVVDQHQAKGQIQRKRYDFVMDCIRDLKLVSKEAES